jgi:hypothetical protein
MIDENFLSQRKDKFHVEKDFINILKGSFYYEGDFESVAMNSHASDRNKKVAKKIDL